MRFDAKSVRCSAVEPVRGGEAVEEWIVEKRNECFG